MTKENFKTFIIQSTKISLFFCNVNLTFEKGFSIDYNLFFFLNLLFLSLFFQRDLWWIDMLRKNLSLNLVSLLYCGNFQEVFALAIGGLSQRMEFSSKSINKIWMLFDDFFKNAINCMGKILNVSIPKWKWLGFCFENISLVLFKKKKFNKISEMKSLFLNWF